MRSDCSLQPLSDRLCSVNCAPEPLRVNPVQGHWAALPLTVKHYGNNYNNEYIANDLHYRIRFLISLFLICQMSVWFYSCTKFLLLTCYQWLLGKWRFKTQEFKTLLSNVSIVSGDRNELGIEWMVGQQKGWKWKLDSNHEWLKRGKRDRQLSWQQHAWRRENKRKIDVKNSNPKKQLGDSLHQQQEHTCFYLQDEFLVDTAGLEPYDSPPLLFLLLWCLYLLLPSSLLTNVQSFPYPGWQRGR